ncbi:hypothetical protein F4V43_06995 [Paenibacillus spiritus]|uniref:Nuclear transport factor 2 family protein n=1 Tax=Paenibacillus spiritus TaxID=2496557 RepID=A0A5J5GCT4_9BACL|nr:hypothetical protein [Paenibacillus spiritus]KAA9005817.1 hypothetical protein F4V43_06995 [Paenibacillus spiritus]
MNTPIRFIGTWTLGLVLLLAAGCRSSSEADSAATASPSGRPTLAWTEAALPSSLAEEKWNPETRAAAKAAESYKQAEYTIRHSDNLLSEASIRQRNDEMRAHLTSDFWTRAVNRRYTLLPLEISVRQKVSLRPENLRFQVCDQTENAVLLDYSADLVLLDGSGQETRRVPVEGRLTLTSAEGDWRVQGDAWDDAALRDLIVP